MYDTDRQSLMAMNPPGDLGIRWLATSFGESLSSCYTPELEMYETVFTNITFDSCLIS